MTPGERALWISIYAAHWNATGHRTELGHYNDEDRARSCMGAADRVVQASRRVDKGDSDYAAEVLG